MHLKLATFSPERWLCSLLRLETTVECGLITYPGNLVVQTERPLDTLDKIIKNYRDRLAKYLHDCVKKRHSNAGY